MNVYVCEFIINGYVMTQGIKAMTKRQAKSICRNILRQRGYASTIKDINVLYIDNSRKSIN